MTPYTHLAAFYDGLTSDVDYPAFADFFETLFRLRNVDVSSIVDLACGTGSMTAELSRRGYDMTGVDMSADMLSIAAGKAPGTLLICQELTNLDLYGTVDAAVCCLDGINYCPPDTLDEIFRRLNLFVRPGGILIFDIHTPEQLKALDGEIFVDEGDGVFCTWRTEFDAAEGACLYGFDIFSKTENDLWVRNTEEHLEYLHEPDALNAALIQRGFLDVRLHGTLRLEEPGPDDKRIFISAVNGGH